MSCCFLRLVIATKSGRYHYTHTLVHVHIAWHPCQNLSILDWHINPASNGCSMTAQCLGTGTSSTVACSLCPPAEARRRELSWEWWKGRKAALSLLHLPAAAHSSAAAFAPSGIDHHHHHHQWSPKQWCSIESALMRPLLQAIGYSGDGNGKERGREREFCSTLPIGCHQSRQASAASSFFFSLSVASLVLSIIIQIGGTVLQHC